MRNCTICNSKLINEHVHFRAKSYNEVGEPEGDIVVYEAWCPSCQIYLTKKTIGKNHGIWESSTVEEKDIENELPNEVVEKLKKSIENLDIENDSFALVKRLWDKFIIMKRAEDKIYFYKDDTQKGCVILRENNRIGKFPDLLNMLEQHYR